MRYAAVVSLLVFVASSSVAGEPTHFGFPGVRQRADAVRGGIQFQPNEDFAPPRHRSTPVACSALADAGDPATVIVDYDGAPADGVEHLRRLDIPDRDVLRIDLEYADPTADLDLILFDGDGIVAISNVDAVGRPESIVAAVEGGTYFIGVSAVQGSSAYTVTSSLADSSSLSCELVSELPRRAPAGRGPWDVEVNRRRGIGRPVPPLSCTFNVSPTTPTVAQAGGTLTINVTSPPGCAWTASSNTSWASVLWGSRAYGNGTAGFRIQPSSGSSSRTGTLTVAGRTVSVTQVGPCTYTVSPTSPQIPSSGGTHTVSVTTRSDCAWTAAVSPTTTWITITSGASGMGNGTVTYNAAPNTATSARTGTMTVAGRTVSVRQALDTSSCTYTLQYTSRTLTWCGGQRSVTVTTQGDCPWTASTNAPFIDLGGTNRSGTGALFYLLSRNTGPARQGTITVAGTPVAITQNARSGGGTYDGVWTGMTNGNRTVDLCVADGRVQDALVRVRLSFPGFSCTGPLTIYNDVPIAGTTFSDRFSFPGSTIETIVRGTFNSPTAMSGSHDGFSGSYLIICGSSLAIGSGTVLSPGTYTATKQP